MKTGIHSKLFYLMHWYTVHCLVAQPCTTLRQHTMNGTIQKKKYSRSDCIGLLFCFFHRLWCYRLILAIMLFQFYLKLINQVSIQINNRNKLQRKDLFERGKYYKFKLTSSGTCISECFEIFAYLFDLLFYFCTVLNIDFECITCVTKYLCLCLHLSLKITYFAIDIRILITRDFFII